MTAPSAWPGALVGDRISPLAILPGSAWLPPVDPVSQGALGAVAAAAFSNRGTVRRAVLVGWAAGMLADADIFISSEADPLLNIEYHRHFSHSLAFIPVGAFLCAAVFWLFLRKRWNLPFRQLYLYALAGYATAGLLDACTSYGTRLLWPFSDARIAWNLISIVDPIFAGGLVVAILFGLIRKKPGWLRGGLVFAACYLSLGWIQRERTLRLQEELASRRGHHIEQATVKPSIGNLLLWRSVYRHDGQFYVDGIRTGAFGEPIIYEGPSVQELTLDDLHKAIPTDSTLGKDLARFDHFSAGFLARHPDQPDVIADLRYAALPQSVNPLWGIRVNPFKVNSHVSFELFREISSEARSDLLRMLKGERLDSPPAE